jgi:hypothetical protein
LLVYVGAVCLSKGVTDLFLAFKLRQVAKELEAA